MQINIAVLTITDTRTMENDKSGSILVKKIAEQKHKLAEAALIKVAKARLRINNCLSQIKGGANKVYWKLRNLFARVEPEKASKNTMYSFNNTLRRL